MSVTIKEKIVYINNKLLFSLKDFPGKIDDIKIIDVNDIPYKIFEKKSLLLGLALENSNIYQINYNRNSEEAIMIVNDNVAYIVYRTGRVSFGVFDKENNKYIQAKKIKENIFHPNKLSKLNLPDIVDALIQSIKANYKTFNFFKNFNIEKLVEDEAVILKDTEHLKKWKKNKNNPIFSIIKTITENFPKIKDVNLLDTNNGKVKIDRAYGNGIYMLFDNENIILNNFNEIYIPKILTVSLNTEGFEFIKSLKLFYSFRFNDFKDFNLDKHINKILILSHLYKEYGSEFMKQDNDKFDKFEDNIIDEFKNKPSVISIINNKAYILLSNSASIKYDATDYKIVLDIDNYSTDKPKFYDSLLKFSTDFFDLKIKTKKGNYIFVDAFIDVISGAKIC